MDWSKEETLRFIDIYRKKDLIWNPKHPDHYNKLRKEDARADISKEMEQSVNICKKKMEYLLAALRREKMKMKKTTATGAGVCDVYKSTWFAFESMRFIWDKNKPRDTLSTFQNTNEQADNQAESGDEDLNTTRDTSQEENPGTSAPSSNKRRFIPPTHVSSNNKKMKKISIEEQRLEKAFEILTTSASVHQQNDDSYHFGNVVASKLRAYDESIRCIIQNEILNVFMRANRGYYNKVAAVPDYEFQTQPTGYDHSLYSSSASPASHIQDVSEESLMTYSQAPSPSSVASPDDFIIQELI